MSVNFASYHRKKVTIKLLRKTSFEIGPYPKKIIHAPYNNFARE